MTAYVVAAIKTWNLHAFERRRKDLPGHWVLVTHPNDLEPTVRSLAPRYVFFPHWSWRVPDSVLGAAECVCFHMTDVPYGRGGSPLQNLIQRGHAHTMLSALRMTAEVDAGPVYLKTPLSLLGRAQDIFERAAGQVYDMIATIVGEEPVPVEQSGEATPFARRRPEESRLPDSGSLGTLFDHIRMLDAETYPAAFLDHGGFRLEFRSAALTDDGIAATVLIRTKDTPR
ncbi:MAG: methionyl-tRNA formyltransferase [Magnetospirillum sp.]|nr:methionyl-tRNA formyltransferase [Magnetospirillum sp.]